MFYWHYFISVVTIFLRVTEPCSHFKIRILKQREVAHDQGHIDNTWRRWSLGSSLLESKDCAGCVVPAVSLFGQEAPRVLRNPIGPQGLLVQSLWVRGTPFNEGN